jgi:hypothetical protein
MPRVTLELTPRMAELLQAGVISITADLFGSGRDVYGRVCNPHPKLGLYPHQSMQLEELEPLLEKVSVPTMTSSPQGESSTGSPMKTPTKKGNPVFVSMRNDPEIGKIPTEIKINGVSNILPKASLSWKDLAHLSDDQLNRRILSIGREIGADKAVSRIEAGQNYSSPRKSTLYKWWESATPEDRLTLISSNKLLGKVDPNDKDRLLSRLGAGQYPFRGSDRKMEADEEEEEGALEEAFETSLRLESSGSESGLRF